MASSRPSPLDRRAGLGALALGLSLAAGGCAEHQDFVTIDRAVWFSDGQSCSLNAGGESLAAMTLDASFETPIGLGVVVTNNQSTNPGSNTGIDDTQVRIESAEISLALADGPVGEPFELSLPSNTLAGNDSEVFLVRVGSEATASVRSRLEGRPAGTIEQLEMTVVVKGERTARVGRSRLGQFESAPFTFPLDVCLGCLVDCTCGCPTATEFAGTCGFAQGTGVTTPGCTGPGGDDGAP